MTLVQVTEAEFAAWACGDIHSCESSYRKLLVAEGHIADRRLLQGGLGKDGTFYRVDIGAAWAKMAAVEVMDLKVSGGLCLLVEKDGTTYGKFTGRQLTPSDFKKMEWRGSNELHSLFRNVLVDF